MVTTIGRNLGLAVLLPMLILAWIVGFFNPELLDVESEIYR
jgi:hypothetical protein